MTRASALNPLIMRSTLIQIPIYILVNMRIIQIHWNHYHITGILINLNDSRYSYFDDQETTLRLQAS